MKMAMYAIQDMKAGAFHSPFVTVNDATAVRLVRDLVQRDGTTYAMHPEDYTLYHLGSFDDISAEIETVEKTAVIQLSGLISLI